MLRDWQSLAAPAVVLITLAAFAFRAWRRARSGRGGCGGGCGCARFGNKRDRFPAAPAGDRKFTGLRTREE